MKQSKQSRLDELEALYEATQLVVAADKITSQEELAAWAKAWDTFHAEISKAAPALLSLARAVKVAQPAIEHAQQRAKAKGIREDVIRAMALKDVLDALAALTAVKGGGD